MLDTFGAPIKTGAMVYLAPPQIYAWCDLYWCRKIMILRVLEGAKKFEPMSDTIHGVMYDWDQAFMDYSKTGSRSMETIVSKDAVPLGLVSQSGFPYCEGIPLKSPEAQKAMAGDKSQIGEMWLEHLRS